MRNNPIKFLYNSIKHSLNYSVVLQILKMARRTYSKNQTTLNILRTAISDEWYKVYKDSYSGDKNQHIQ